jgi:hypothetical protein
LLEDSQNRAQRQLNEANAEAAELIRRANEQAEAEFADRRSAVLDEVRGLEGRRGQLADVISQLESRLAGYREELGRTAQEITALAEDPSRLGARPNMSMAPDEILSSEPDPAPAPSEVAEPPAAAEPAVDLADEPVDAVEAEGEDRTESGGTGGGAGATALASSGGTATAVVTDAPPVEEQDSHYVDLTGQAPTTANVGTDDRWGPGTWSQVEADLIEDAEVVGDPSGHIDTPTEAVGRAEVPRDRFMEELDSAVNEAVPVGQDDDAAMTAFFEGTNDSRTRRFGWRR